MTGTKKAIFSTGSLSDSVLIKVKDFIQMEEAKMADIAMKGGYKIPKATKKKMIKVKNKVASKKKVSIKKKPVAKKVNKKPVKKVVKKKVAKKKKI